MSGVFSRTLGGVKYTLDRVCWQCQTEETISGYGNAPLGATCHRCGQAYQDRQLQHDLGYTSGQGMYMYPTPPPYSAYAFGERRETKKKLPKSTHQGVIVGFRYWKLNTSGLQPIVHGTSWKVGVNKAECPYCASLGMFTTTVEPPRVDHSPDANCTCGFHLRSVPDPVDLGHAYADKNHVVLGACLAWGRILMHGTAGCRAEYARPVLLAYDPAWTRAKQRLVQGLAEDYDCRAVPVSYPDVEAGVCEPLLVAAREYGRLMSEMEIT